MNKKGIKIVDEYSFDNYHEKDGVLNFIKTKRLIPFLKLIASTFPAYRDVDLGKVDMVLPKYIRTNTKAGHKILLKTKTINYFYLNENSEEVRFDIYNIRCLLAFLQKLKNTEGKLPVLVKFRVKQKPIGV